LSNLKTRYRGWNLEITEKEGGGAVVADSRFGQMFDIFVDEEGHVVECRAARDSLESTIDEIWGGADKKREVPLKKEACKVESPPPRKRIFKTRREPKFGDQ